MTCECGYVKGPHTFTHNEGGYTNHNCRCDLCRTAWRGYHRRHRHSPPSLLACEVDRLTNELDAAEMHIEALREENTMLYCRLDELNTHQ